MPRKPRLKQGDVYSPLSFDYLCTIHGLRYKEISGFKGVRRLLSVEFGTSGGFSRTRSMAICSRFQVLTVGMKSLSNACRQQQQIAITVLCLV